MYNRGVKRIAWCAAALLFLAACGQKNIENKEAIRQAVVDYLTARQAQTGLDPAAMDVNVIAMSFERDTARATVEFRVKNGDGGMQLNYKLDRKGDKWVVEAREDSGQGHGVVAPGDSSALPGIKGQLPPGHPTIPQTAPKSETTPKQ